MVANKARAGVALPEPRPSHQPGLVKCPSAPARKRRTVGRIEQTPLDGESDFLSRPTTVARNPTIPQKATNVSKRRHRSRTTLRRFAPVLWVRDAHGTGPGLCGLPRNRLLRARVDESY